MVIRLKFAGLQLNEWLPSVAECVQNDEAVESIPVSSRLSLKLMLPLPPPMTNDGPLMSNVCGETPSETDQMSVVVQMRRMLQEVLELTVAALADDAATPKATTIAGMRRNRRRSMGQSFAWADAS
jgi:hypothetical protein